VKFRFVSSRLTAQPDRLGVLGGDKQGFPNGRRLSDDVVDIELKVLEGALLNQKTNLGDGVNANNIPFASSFPYVSLPIPGSSTSADGHCCVERSPAWWRLLG